ncbi:hypothetical protein ACWGDS_19175 [Streptomyces sp. NPDC055059]|uniref:Integral membrane protein n=1 Tax=Streptomyces sp. NBC_00119 TaxID=2975659 RepID=A0AAU1U4W4_9ACTN|nr:MULTISPECIES: hypothetical protein [unclassified Streptomyces]MCX4643006.1 hypothetical protein [Streptomyces sp. NBC_01446]MCX5324131.1 hypothetical protein [Streptomyces sp. NBC_00120]
MVTKTDDETTETPESTTAEAAEVAAESSEVIEATKEAEGTDAAEAADAPEGADTDFDDEPFASGAPVEDSSGAGQGAGAVVSAALGVVALSGSWVATVASARESLIGQLQTSQGASVAKQVSEVYGDSWHATALVGGIFALLALIVGAVVLARPAFGAPGRPQAVWIKSVAWAGVSLGILGLLLAVAKYTDILMALPSTSS